MTLHKIAITSEEVIDRYADMVYRLALLHVNNPSDADDVFQEVFIRLVKHIQKLQNWEHIKAWLIRVTINCSNTQFERAAFKKNVPLEEVMESGFDEEGFEEAEGDGQQHITHGNGGKFLQKFTLHNVSKCNHSDSSFLK